MRILITIATLVARAIYAVLELLPRRHKVVLLSRQADLPSKDFTLLADALRRRDTSLEVVVRCRFIHSGIFARASYVGEVLIQMYHLATSRVCVTDGYIVPLSILTHSNELFVIQAWHALGAIKQFGYQSIGQSGGRPAKLAEAMRMHRNYDVVLCGGPGSVAGFAAAFDVDPAIVLPLGLPRVDYLREASGLGESSRIPRSIQSLQERYPRLTDESKIVVLYAPTFRWNRHSAYREVAEAFAGEAFTLVIKPHDLDSGTIPSAHVIDATGVNVLDLLPLCDAVLTDYSAVAFEAACIEKPVYFYVYDIDEYRSSLGLNIDPLEVLPAASSRSVTDLVTRIGTLDYNAVAARTFREGFVPSPDVSCTQQISDLIFSRLKAPR